MMDAQEFWDRMSARYAARPVGDVESWDATLERTRAYLGPETQVLEIGCGTGSSALKLAGDVGHLTGTDISPAMIDIANGKKGDLTNLSFKVGGLESLSGQYDAVIAYNLLQLIADVPKAAGQAFALTKPGGVFVSKTACIASMWYIKPIIWVAQLLGKAPFVNFLSVAGLERALSDAGFVIEVSDAIPAKGRNQFVVARRP